MEAPCSSGSRVLGAHSTRGGSPWLVLAALLGLSGAVLAVAPVSSRLSAAGLVLVFVPAVLAAGRSAHRADVSTSRAWWYLTVALSFRLLFEVIGLTEAVGLLVRPPVSGLLLAAVYPVAAYGLVLLLRRGNPRRDYSGAVDSLVVVVAVGLLIWAFLLEPSLHDPSGEPGTLLRVALPLGDVLILGLGLRLWFAMGPALTRSLRLLGIGLLGALLGDLAFAAGLTGQLSSGADWVSRVGWCTLALFSILAAFDRSAGSLPSAQLSAVAPSTLRYGTLLAFACLAPPLAALTRGAEEGLAHTAVLVAGSVLLSVLTIHRMSGLVTTLQVTVRRERTLREGTASLAAVADVDSLRMATLRTLRGLLRSGTADPGAWMLQVDGDEVAVLAASGTGEPPGPLPVLAELGSVDGSRLLVRSGSPRVLTALGVPIGTKLTIVPIGSSEGPRELAVVATTGSPPQQAVTMLRTFAAAVGLAQDRIALARSLVERRSLNLLRRMLADSTDVILLVDLTLEVRHATPAVARLLGVSPEELAGGNVLDVVEPDDHDLLRRLTRSCTREQPQTAELRLSARDRSQRCVEIVASPVSDDDEPGYVLTCHDVTERRELERELAHQAFHDSLTGLANRALFRDRLEQALAWDDAPPFSVLFCDLDDFKTVNDGLGHPAGDELLRIVTALLQENLRPGDIAARLGGDEFAILLQAPVSVEDACRIAERILEALAQPVVVHGAEIIPSASIGIAMSDAGSTAPATLMSDADLALYVAKNAGKRQYAVFEPRMHQHALDRLTVTSELRRAIDGDEMALQFQPFVRLADGVVTGFEALVRWRHPERGLLEPRQFISLAEDAGLIVPLGRWVMEEALRTLASWRDAPGRESLKISVNVSGRQMQYPGIVEDVRSALADSGVPPSMCILEITESVLLPDESTVDRLRALREIGVSVYIDDFGTGYSSLSYLRQLPIDGLKVAREFVEGLADNDPDVGLVGTIRDLGRTLGLEAVVAEGIENAGQLRALRLLGYEIGQGFHLGVPMTADQARHLLSWAGVERRGGGPWSEHLPLPLRVSGPVRALTGGPAARMVTPPPAGTPAMAAPPAAVLPSGALPSGALPSGAPATRVVPPPRSAVG